MKQLKTILSAVVAAVSLSLAGSVNASLTLTAAGISDGFTLSTFVSGYSAQYGPLAQGILPNGNVLTGSLITTPNVGPPAIFVFPDVDGQTLASALIAKPYTCETSNCNFAIATAGGQVYGAQAFGGIYYHFDNNGNATPIPNLVAAGLRGFLGMWGDPVNGDIIAASSAGLVEINPVAGTFRIINGGLFPDGVTVTADGSTAYVENGGEIQSYSIATGALLNSYPSTIGPGPDGTGVISGGKFNGDVIVNNNNGTVGLLDPVTGVTTIIADLGTRGDFVSPDLSNGTLFLSQNELVDRLSCGPGCTIGGGTAPEPATLTLLALGLAGLGFSRRRNLN